jgi:hypothetical protein
MLSFFKQIFLIKNNAYNMQKEHYNLIKRDIGCHYFKIQKEFDTIISFKKNWIFDFIQKQYILVTKKNKNVEKLLKSCEIEIIDKMNFEKYCIFMIKTYDYQIDKIQEFEWVVQISQGKMLKS